MELNDYQKKAMRTLSGDSAGEKRLLNAAMGLCGESGEVMDHLKKYLFQGHDLDVQHLCREVGDILWYCALFAEAAGVPLDQIAQDNIDKLTARYPQGFDSERSRHRAPQDD